MLDRGNLLQNRYTIKRIIKAGKLSNVYLVEDSQLIKEWVLKEFLIKIENPRLMELALRNFEKEVAILASLKHTGIPEIVDYFTENGRQYLVMEYIPGKSLDKILEETFHPMYEPEVVNIGVQIAAILYHLHRQIPPIFFRKLIPSHIMITPGGKVKLIDFDLGRHFKPFKDIRRKKSGTPGYAPPEQIAQNIVNEQTDIYALGAILHQMITLRDPSELSNVFKFPDITTLNPKATPALAKIISKATAYKPSERYFSALEMKRDLDALKKEWEAHISSDIPIKRENSQKPRSSSKGAKALPTTEITLPPELTSSSRSTSPKKANLFKSFLRKPVWFKIATLAGISFLVTLIVLGIFKIYHWNKKPKNTVESPYALVKDRRILEYRKKGIELYKEGKKTSDTVKLASAVNYLTKVVSAHPTDVISQVYLQNSYVLLKNDKYVKVAALLSLTGDDFESGAQMLAGIGLAQALHNKSDKGPPIFVEVCDDESSLEKAVQIAAKLSKRKDLLAVIGPIRTPFLLNTSALLNEAKIVQIAPTGVCAGVENLGRYIFRIMGGGRNIGINMADIALRKLGLKRIVLLYDPAQGYSKAIADIFYQEAQRIGGAEIKRIQVSLDSKSYKKAVEEIKKYKPDGIFFVAYHMHQAKLAKELKKAHVRAVHLAPVAAYSIQLINQGGKAVEGIIFNSFFFPEITGGEGEKFVKLYREKYGGVYPNFRAAAAYDAMRVVSLGVEHGATTPRELLIFIRKELKKEMVFGATGKLSFDEYGRREEINFFPMTVKNGKFTLYKPKKR